MISVGNCGPRTKSESHTFSRASSCWGATAEPVVLYIDRTICSISLRVMIPFSSVSYSLNTTKSRKGQSDEPHQEILAYVRASPPMNHER
jgi:hypothetical protein